jgi:hypothetical protein
MYAINAKRKLYQLQYLHLLRRLVNMLPAKKPSLSPATQVLAPSFKPTPYNPTSQTPANAFFKLTGPHPPPLKHPQHPPHAPATLSLLKPSFYHTNNNHNNKHFPNTTPVLCLL